MNFENDIKIDPEALDVEWLRQPALTLQFCKLEAELKKDVDKLEIELSLIRAELDKDIRTNPEKFKITTKLTETVISNTIIGIADYQECYEALLAARFEHSISKGAVKAIDTKKSSLENLVKLHGQQYFAGPSVPRDLSKEWEQKRNQEDTDKKVKIRRRK